MEARTGIVIGGMSVVAASVAVVTIVALTNTVALADSPGTSIASERLVVPPTATPSQTSAAPATTPAPVAPAAEPEVVQAPAPVVVDASPDAIDGTAGASGAGRRAGVADDLDSAIAAAKAAGSWEAVRAWAATQGWSSGRTEALIARLQREDADQDEQGGSNRTENQSSSGDSSGSRNAESLFVQRQSVADLQIEEAKQSGQPSTGSQRPAHAGSNVGNGNGAGNGEKKDQSRNSPVKRD